VPGRAGEAIADGLDGAQGLMDRAMQRMRTQDPSGVRQETRGASDGLDRSLKDARDAARGRQDAGRAGYTVVVCFVGLSIPELSAERVAMRVSQGGHDVAWGKLRSRYGRTLHNLDIAARTLADVLVFDNSDLRRPFRKVAWARYGHRVWKRQAFGGVAGLGMSPRMALRRVRCLGSGSGIALSSACVYGCCGLA